MANSPELLNEGERVVVRTRTHPKALLAPLLALVVLLAAASAVAVLLDSPAPRYAAQAALSLAALGLVVRPVLTWLSASYTFTDRRLLTSSGVLVRRGHDVPLARISDVEVEVGPVDRLLGCGTLVLSDVSPHRRIVLRAIPQVEVVRKRVRALLHEELVEASTRHEGI